MPHLIPLLRPPTLSLERGITSTTALGHEVLLYEGHSDQPEKIADLHSAIGRLATSTHTDIQELCKRIETNYRLTTKGAPDDAEFAHLQGAPVLRFLHQADTDTLRQFSLWNNQRVLAQKDAMAYAMPQLQADIMRRSAYLAGCGLLPTKGKQAFERLADTLKHPHAYYPLDSFEGGLTKGLANKHSIYIAHSFRDGYTFGQPDAEYNRIGFHEVGHQVRMHNGGDTAFRAARVIEEVLIAHYTAVSDEESTTPPDNLYAAIQPGDHYEQERRLISLVLQEYPNPYVLTAAGNVLVGTGESLHEEFVYGHIRRSFTKLFPEYDVHALDCFLHAYTTAPIFSRRRIAQTWAHKAHTRQYNTPI